MIANPEIEYLKQSLDCRDVISRDLGQPITTGQTWTFNCPFHAEHTPGGFHVYADGYKCYSCGEHGDIFDWRKKYHKESFHQAYEALGGKPTPPDPVEVAKRAAENARRAEVALQTKIEEANKAMAELRQAQAWLKYHEGMTDAARRLWEQRGINEGYQSFWKLGYDPDHVIYTNHQEYHTPTLTIPIWEAGTWECVNIRHRLLRPPSSGDKYRPERAGLPAPLFVANPDNALQGKTLICEGEIKSMVAFITADDPRLQVVGIPGKNPADEMLAKLKDCDPVYLCLDPDAQTETYAIAADLGRERVRVIELPDKIDDLILRYGLDKDWMIAILKQAKKA